MKILSVIVLYKCKLEDSNTYCTLLKSSNSTIFVYDNSPEAQAIHVDNVIYVHDPNNSGLGVAYNQAAQYAKKNHFEWMLIADQDTHFPAGAMDAYRKAIEEHSEVRMIVPIHQISDGRYISPSPYFLKGSHPIRRKFEGVLKFSHAAPINSGIMISTDAFFEAGGYDEEVKLDFSDIRFIEKFQKIYPTYFAMPEVVCLQEFSIQEKDANKLMTRYKIFLSCALACHRDNFMDTFGYLFVTCKRTLRLTLQCRTWSFLKVYFKDYLLK